MGAKVRNHYTKEFKFKVALAACKGDKQLAELAEEFRIHPTMISSWKRQFLERGAEIFDMKGQQESKEREERTEELIHTIGHQQVTIDWLKKKLGFSEEGHDRL